MPDSFIHLKCVPTPSNALAITNKVYINPDQFDGKKVHYLMVQGKDKDIVYSAEAHPEVPMGCVAMNKIHRSDLRLNLEKIGACSVFVPPEHDFLIDEITLEVNTVSAFMSQSKIDGMELESHLKESFSNQVLLVGQSFAFQFEGSTFVATVTEISNCQTSDWVKGDQSKEVEVRGKLFSDSNIRFEKAKGSSIQFENVALSSKRSTNILKSGASFQKIGIGGLDVQLGKMFRRAFASRIYPPEIIKKLGVKHIKGILLYGPPGCGKTLMARQIGKLLNAKEPKVVNGPEILNKYVGESEANIRNLFADAEQEYAEKGDESDLHLIIFDEIDAICKQRGTVNSGTGVNDSVVNQLLSKIDGVNPLNNVLLIGMTNRMDLIDEALLRPGRFEVQTEIGLPDENGRIQILNIHTTNMKENNALAEDVNIENLASRTKNFSGAELEGLVKSASSFALNRNIDMDHLENIPTDISDKIKVTRLDFEKALEEVKPAFGVSTDELDSIISQGIINYGPTFSNLKATLQTFVSQVRDSTKSSILSVLFEGEPGSGKTCLAATIAKESEFPYLKIVSPQTMVGFSEAMKCNKLTKIFDDAYKSPLSIIVLDDIERLVDYVNIGPRFSNTVLQTLLVLIKKAPPKGRKLLIIGTTSQPKVLETLEILESFNIVTTVPTLNTTLEIQNVLSACDAFSDNKEIIKDILPLTPTGIAIKKLLLAVEMASARAKGKDINVETFRNSILDALGRDFGEMYSTFQNLPKDEASVNDFFRSSITHEYGFKFYGFNVVSKFYKIICNLLGSNEFTCVDALLIGRTYPQMADLFDFLTKYRTNFLASMNKQNFYEILIKLHANSPYPRKFCHFMAKLKLSSIPDQLMVDIDTLSENRDEKYRKIADQIYGQ